jgi:hypothetical protein
MSGPQESEVVLVGPVVVKITAPKEMTTMTVEKPR